jgi:hypothetical protein
MLTLRHKLPSGEADTFTWKIGPHNRMLSRAEVGPVLSLIVDGAEFSLLDRNFGFSAESPENYAERYGDGVIRVGQDSGEFTGEAADYIIDELHLWSYSQRESAAMERDARISGYLDD